ncbi:MAG: hypothetical protein Q4C96_05375 [Planctomycetia bacterium]|nr:hypothetical protein [Planctomycetia bacterium]
MKGEFGFFGCQGKFWCKKGKKAKFFQEKKNGSLFIYKVFWLILKRFFQKNIKKCRNFDLFWGFCEKTS